MVYWRISGERKNKSADVISLAWISRHLSVDPLIEHDQQPMEIHT